MKSGRDWNKQWMKENWTIWRSSNKRANLKPSHKMIMSTWSWKGGIMTTKREKSKSFKEFIVLQFTNFTSEGSKLNKSCSKYIWNKKEMKKTEIKRFSNISMKNLTHWQGMKNLNLGKKMTSLFSLRLIINFFRMTIKKYLSL